MKDELQQHKTSDKVKWILTLIAFILVGVMLIGIILGWFAKKEVPQEPQSSSVQTGGMVVGEEKGNGIALMSAAIAAEDYEDYGISTQAESAYTLTATITPFDADNQEVDWAVAFVNPSSTWATGKTVTTYVTVTPQSDGAKTASVQCLKAFGEQIKITVTSRDNSSATAQCTADYVARVASVAWEMGGNTGNFSVSNGPGSFKVLPDSQSGECGIQHTVTKGDHTKSANYVLSYKYFEFDFGRYGLSDIRYSGGTKQLKSSDCSQWYGMTQCLTVKDIIAHCFSSVNDEARYYIKNRITQKVKAGETILGRLVFSFTSTDEGAQECTGYMYVLVSADLVTTAVTGVGVSESNLSF